MSTCIPKKKVKRVRLFALDACGRMIITGTPVLDWEGFNEIRFQNLIDDGQDETITNVYGDTCVDDQACPVDRGVQWSFTECKENDAFAALTGHGTIVMAALETVGFDRKKMSGCSALAAELLFEVPSLCDAGGAAQCVAVLIPSLTLFKDTNERLIDGKNTLRGTYTARAKLNSRLFELTGVAGPGNLPPAELAHWTPWVANIDAGDSWFLRRIVDCPTLGDPQSCELRALDNL